MGRFAPDPKQIVTKYGRKEGRREGRRRKTPVVWDKAVLIDKRRTLLHRHFSFRS